ncbi:hypothetical protein [Protofrankia sp. BMG5.30]|uniref:hypothetical protein n=1 Tax=Protofrankia sp. BMG5.30 TaxID=1834514 RepID=UPI0009783AB0|nr:hypothetical protein BL254_17860 [Protofrankia sp. BMG5.30]
MTDAQKRDKVTGELVWAVRMMDADPNARAGSAEVKVKIAAAVRPVPPESLAGTPFRPVEFDGLTLAPYVNTNGAKPRLVLGGRDTAGAHGREAGRGMTESTAIPDAGAGARAGGIARACQRARRSDSSARCYITILKRL